MFLYIGFVLLILTMVFMAYQHDVPLVSDDYYEKELKYQDEINQIKNALALKSPISIEYNADEKLLIIHFPSDNTGRISGKIEFMRPSDPKLDTDLSVNVNEQHTQEVSTVAMAKGLWQFKIYWENGGKKYLQQQDLIL